MPVYKLFFKQLSYRKGSIIMYAAIFFTLLFVFSSMGSSAVDTTGFTESSTSLVISDKDKTSASKAIIAYLTEGNQIKEVDSDADTLRDSLYQFDTDAVLVIPKGFERGLLSGSVLPIDVDTALDNFTYKYLLDAKLTDYIGNISLYLASGQELSEAILGATKAADLTAKVERNDASGYTSQEDMPTGYYYYRYVAYIFLALMLAAVGPSLVSFYKKQLFMRSACSGTPSSRYNLQLALGILTFTGILCLTFNLIGFVLSRQFISIEQFLLAAANTLAVMIVSVSITCLCGFISKTENAMSAFANVISLMFSFLGGIFVPIEFLGGGISKFARLIPTYWYTTANNSIFASTDISSKSLGTIGQSILIQLISAVSVFAVALLVSRRRLQSSSL